MELHLGYHSTKVSQLADTLSLAISQGEFKVGDPLPSINYLSARYAISRDTVFKAFLNLRERGLIDSVPGKGYYVTNKYTNVLLLLDEYSPFKEALYNRFSEKLPSNYIVDLIFHQYNERLFNTIVRDSYERYNKYVVMNFDNENFSGILQTLDARKLLLMDFGKFDKTGYAYLCQDFDQGFYNGLRALRSRLGTYKKFVFVFAKGLNHPQSSKEYFTRFCQDHKLPHAIVDSIEDEPIEQGTAYLVIRQRQVIALIKKAREQGLRCGKDYGLVAYNECPAYEIMDVGITSLSVNFEEMGTKAADFVVNNTPLKEYLPTQVTLRHSL